MSAGVLRALRVELADTIGAAGAELTVYDHVPGRVQLPAAFVMAGAPYIEQGQTFGSATVRFAVVLLTQPALNSVETDLLDERIETVQQQLQDAGWLVERVDQPQLQELNGQELLAVQLAIATDTEF